MAKSVQAQLNSITSRIEVAIQEVLQEIAGEYIKDWQELVQKSIDSGVRRGKRGIRHYKSTGDTVKSIMILDETATSILIGYNIEKITPSKTPVGNWNKHMDTFGKTEDGGKGGYFVGRDASDQLPLFIEHGQKSSVYSYEGIDAIGKIQKKVDKEFKKKVKSKLAKRGIKVV